MDRVRTTSRPIVSGNTQLYVSHQPVITCIYVLILGQTASSAEVVFCGLGLFVLAFDCRGVCSWIADASSVATFGFAVSR